MTDLEKIKDQLEKAMNELKELEVEETQLAFDYVEYANILVKKLIIGSVSNRRKLLIDFFRKTSKVQADDKGNMWLVEKCVDEYLKDN